MSNFIQTATNKELGQIISQLKKIKSKFIDVNLINDDLHESNFTVKIIKQKVKVLMIDIAEVKTKDKQEYLGLYNIDKIRNKINALMN